MKFVTGRFMWDLTVPRFTGFWTQSRRLGRKPFAQQQKRILLQQPVRRLRVPRPPLVSYAAIKMQRISGVSSDLKHQLSVVICALSLITQPIRLGLDNEPSKSTFWQV